MEVSSIWVNSSFLAAQLDLFTPNVIWSHLASIKIRKADIISKMVCHPCCELVEKIYRYRISAINNDKQLKERLGQSYIPPVTDLHELERIGAKILADEDDVQNDMIMLNPSNAIQVNASPPYRHDSVKKLIDEHPGIELPDEVNTSDIDPRVSLDEDEIKDWHFLQYQKRLSIGNIRIKKISSSFCENKSDNFEERARSEKSESMAKITVVNVPVQDGPSCAKVDRSSAINSSVVCVDTNTVINTSPTKHSSLEESIFSRSKPCPKSKQIELLKSKQQQLDFSKSRPCPKSHKLEFPKPKACPRSLQPSPKSQLFQFSKPKPCPKSHQLDSSNHRSSPKPQQLESSKPCPKSQQLEIPKPKSCPTTQPFQFSKPKPCPKSHQLDSSIEFPRPKPCPKSKQLEQLARIKQSHQLQQLDTKPKPGPKSKQLEQQWQTELSSKSDQLEQPLKITPHPNPQQLEQQLLLDNLNSQLESASFGPDTTESLTSIINEVLTPPLEVSNTQINQVSTTTTEVAAPKKKRKRRKKLVAVDDTYEEILPLKIKRLYSCAVSSAPTESSENVATNPYHNDDFATMLHFTNSIETFSCEVCGRLYDTKKQLRAHRRLHLSCKYCRKKITSAKRLQIHENQTCHVKIMQNPPNLALTRVDEIQNLKEKYKDAFDGLNQDDTTISDTEPFIDAMDLVEAIITEGKTPPVPEVVVLDSPQGSPAEQSTMLEKCLEPYPKTPRVDTRVTQMFAHIPTNARYNNEGMPERCGFFTDAEMNEMFNMRSNSHQAPIAHGSSASSIQRKEAIQPGQLTMPNPITTVHHIPVATSQHAVLNRPRAEEEWLEKETLQSSVNVAQKYINGIIKKPAQARVSTKAQSRPQNKYGDVPNLSHYTQKPSAYNQPTVANNVSNPSSNNINAQGAPHQRRLNNNQANSVSYQIPVAHSNTNIARSSNQQVMYGVNHPTNIPYANYPYTNMPAPRSNPAINIIHESRINAPTKPTNTARQAFYQPAPAKDARGVPYAMPKLLPINAVNETATVAFEYPSATLQPIANQQRVLNYSIPNATTITATSFVVPDSTNLGNATTAPQRVQPQQVHPNPVNYSLPKISRIETVQTPRPITKHLNPAHSSNAPNTVIVRNVSQVPGPSNKGVGVQPSGTTQNKSGIRVKPISTLC